MKRKSFYTLIGILIVSLVYIANAQDNSDTIIQLHGELDTGLTSCALEAGNGFDLTFLSVEQPFVVEVVRFYAQSFPNMGDAPVTVSVYEDSDSDPTNGASLLATAEPVTVGGNSPHPYTVPFNNMRVTQPYLYVVLSFTSATVINASSSSQQGGFSFGTHCDETGLENVSTPITLDDIRLGIEVIGHPEQSNNALANQNSVPSVSESIVVPSLVPTETSTIDEAPLVTEIPTEASGEEVAASTEESLATVEVAPTELSPELTPELTPEVTPELTEEAGDA